MRLCLNQPASEAHPSYLTPLPFVLPAICPCHRAPLVKKAKYNPVILECTAPDGGKHGRAVVRCGMEPGNATVPACT